MEEKEKGSLKGGMRMGVTLEREAVFSLPQRERERERSRKQDPRSPIFAV